MSCCLLVYKCRSCNHCVFAKPETPADISAGEKWPIDWPYKQKQVVIHECERTPHIQHGSIYGNPGPLEIPSYSEYGICDLVGFQSYTLPTPDPQ